MQAQAEWSGKPYIRKTIVKIIVLYSLGLLLFIWVPLLFVLYTVASVIFAGFYLYWKRAHTYYVTSSSIIISREWVFGRYQREITFDRIQDIHVQQGILARAFGCGSVVFVTAAGLEVKYAGVGGGRYIYLGGLVPRLVRGAWNSFIDVVNPVRVREIIMKHVVSWREVVQQQRMAAAVERIAERGIPAPAGVSLAEELSKLKKLLDEGAITKEEYERAKKKLLGE